MKIHGTAKGAALSTKDFGVAFGGAAAAPEVCQDESDAEDPIQLFIPPASGNQSGNGVRITDTGSGADFVGLTVNTVKVWLKKRSGDPDNSFSVGIYRNEGTVGNELYNFHNGDLSEITTTSVQYEFTGSSGTHTIADGDIICVMKPSNTSILYSKIENSTISGLDIAFFNSWDQYANWDKWSIVSTSSFTFCLK